LTPGWGGKEKGLNSRTSCIHTLTIYKGMRIRAQRYQTTICGNINSQYKRDRRPHERRGGKALGRGDRKTDTRERKRSESNRHPLLLAAMRVMMWKRDWVSRRARGNALVDTADRHRLPLIESTRCLIPPKRDLLPLEREPEFGDGSSAGEKPIFASLLAREIC